MNASASLSAASKSATARLTLLLALATESIFFGTLVMAYLYLRGSTPVWAAFPHTWARLALPLVNMAVLWASAIAGTRSLSAARRDHAAGVRIALAANLALGLAFVAGQAVDFGSSGVRPADSAFAGLFFTLLGFHALHVLAGLVLQGLNLARARLGDFRRDDHAALSVGVGFWWYVVAVWVVLFVVVYLI